MLVDQIPMKSQDLKSGMYETRSDTRNPGTSIQKYMISYATEAK